MSNQPITSHIYRSSTPGKCLVKALDKLITEEGKLPGALGLDILTQFDMVMAKCLEQDVTAKATLKGKLVMYKYVDSSWEFVLDNASLRLAPLMTSSKKDEEDVIISVFDQGNTQEAPDAVHQEKKRKRYDERKLLKLRLVDKNLVKFEEEKKVDDDDDE